MQKKIAFSSIAVGAGVQKLDKRVEWQSFSKERNDARNDSMEGGGAIVKKTIPVKEEWTITNVITELITLSYFSN